MRDFEYKAPTTLAQALDLMSSGPAARPLAGGTDLIDHVRTGRLAPDLIVDVKKLPELKILEFSPEGLRLGAAIPCYTYYGDERIYKKKKIRALRRRENPKVVLRSLRFRPHHRRNADPESGQHRRQCLHVRPCGRFDSHH